MIQIKLLNAKDADQMVNLAENEKELLKIQLLINWFTSNLRQPLIIGAFFENKLVGISSLFFAQKRPWVSLVYLKTNTQLSTTTRLKTLIELVDESFRLAEERNCCRVFMVNFMKRRGVFKNAKLFPLVKKIKRLQEYNFISETLVKAGEKPQFDYEWELMGMQISQEDIGIVSGTRKVDTLNV